MSAIIQHLSTILTLASSEYINTGNRALDNSIVGLSTFIIIQTINYITNDWKSVYNTTVFYLYNMKEHPLDMSSVPFIHIDEYETKEQFQQKYSGMGICAFFYKHGIKFDSMYATSDKLEDMLLLLGNIIVKNKKYMPITNKKSGTLLSDNALRNINVSEANLPLYYGDETTKIRIPEGVYLITIDNKGEPIYYSSEGMLLFNSSRSTRSFTYLSQYVIPALAKEYQNFKKELSSKKVPKNIIFGIKRSANSSGNGVSLSLKAEGTISSKKTFDTLFYSQKEELLNVLNKFRDGCMYPSHVPMDNKLGIMLYGPPGTGKTGTISAIANYLERNLTVINFSEISCTDDLDRVLDSAKYKETIFVFDELDYLLDALGSDRDKASGENIDWSKILMVTEGGERQDLLNTIKQNAQQTKKTLSVSYLLQKLDGLESADNRVIIATTNNPDRINPALMRPGRFDIKICLGNCTQDMYGKILENYYREEKDVYNKVLGAKIQTYKYSPLELINLAMQSDTLDILLEKIFCQCEIEKITSK